jgi:hypothetical protein
MVRVQLDKIIARCKSKTRSTNIVHLKLLQFRNAAPEVGSLV